MYNNFSAYNFNIFNNYNNLGFMKLVRCNLIIIQIIKVLN